ncbi:hypothetical protein D3C84_868360 [compost metagenome]
MDRHPAPALHQPAEGPAEQAVLAEPARVQAQYELHREENHEIPVGGVVGADHHKLVEVRHAPFDAPAHQLEHAVANRLGEWITGQVVTVHGEDFCVFPGG